MQFCNGCGCASNADVNDADSGVQYENDDRSLVPVSERSAPTSLASVLGNFVGDQIDEIQLGSKDSKRHSRYKPASGGLFGSNVSKDSGGSKGSKHRRPSQFGSSMSASKYSSAGTQHVRSRKLQSIDLQMSQSLREQLGMGEAKSPQEDLEAETPRAEDTGESSSPAPTTREGINKTIASMLAAQARNQTETRPNFSSEETPEELPVRQPSKESANGPARGRRNSLSLFGTMLRIKQFRKSMVAVKAPNELELTRSLQIEGIYDFYTFEDKKVRVRKMNQDVFHERLRDDDLEREPNEMIRQASSDSSGSKDDSLDSASEGDSETDAAESDGALPGARRRKRRSKRPTRMPLVCKTRFNSAVGRDDNPEACTHWGVVVGKILHTRALDFTGILDKAGHHMHTMKYQATAGAKGAILNSVRERARIVAKQAWHIAKKISIEKKDCFDNEWNENGLLVELFSTEYFDTLALFANTARKILSVQPTMVSVNVPCKIFGDIHGQFRDLLLLFKAFGRPDEHDAPMFVFNGDFVDRGAHQLEVIGLLLALKILLPERVWLIRGNHEDRQMNKRYGFEDECKRQLGVTLGPKMFDLMQNTFDMLPVAALVEEKVLVVHGGIGDGFWKVSDLRKVKRPLVDEQLAEDWIANLLWSDPIEDDDKNQETFGVHASPRGGTAAQFGWNVTKTFCARNGLSLVVRSHQSKMGSPGFDIMHESLLMRVFSARDYEGHGNDGAILYLQNLEAEGQQILMVRPQVLWSTTKAKHQESARRRSVSVENDPNTPKSPPGRRHRRKSV